MESEDHLYITLPSSASLDLHPNNKISDFKTELLNTIHFEREMYEVGLSEIILDANIENVPENRAAFTIYRSDNYVKNTLKLKNTKGLTLAKVDGKMYYCEKFTVRRGLYNTLSEMFRHFNKKFIASTMCHDLVFRTTKPLGEVLEIVSLKSWRSENLHDINTFYFHPLPWFRKCISAADNASIDAPDIIPSVKAFISVLYRYFPNVEEYPAAADPSKFSKSLHFICDPKALMQDPGMAYVYTDIVEHQHVGDTKASLLRVVPFSNGLRVITFPNVHYLPLSKDYLNSIHVYIRDVEGKPYPFTGGAAVCKVHIRRKLR